MSEYIFVINIFEYLNIFVTLWNVMMMIMVRKRKRRRRRRKNMTMPPAPLHSNRLAWHLSGPPIR